MRILDPAQQWRIFDGPLHFLFAAMLARIYRGRFLGKHCASVGRIAMRKEPRLAPFVRRMEQDKSQQARRGFAIIFRCHRVT